MNIHLLPPSGRLLICQINSAGGKYGPKGATERKCCTSVKQTADERGRLLKRRENQVALESQQQHLGKYVCRRIYYRVCCSSFFNFPPFSPAANEGRCLMAMHSFSQLPTASEDIFLKKEISLIFFLKFKMKIREPLFFWISFCLFVRLLFFASSSPDISAVPDTGVTLMAADAGETRSADVWWRRKRRGRFNCRCCGCCSLGSNNILRFFTIISIFTLDPASSYRLASVGQRFDLFQSHWSSAVSEGSAGGMSTANEAAARLICAVGMKMGPGTGALGGRSLRRKRPLH